MRFKPLLLSFLFLVFGVSSSIGQLADGTIAPDFTLTDINGTTHHLYDYLAQGKLVVLDFSATWCGPCWSYHNSGALENLYLQNGPSGTDDVMVFMIEADISTDMNDLNGTDQASQGDWISGTPYPIIDLQSNSLNTAYSISYFPTIYAICPTDYTVYEAGQVPTSTLYSWTQSCTLSASLNTSSDANCYGEGFASVNVNGGLSPISYSWSNGSSSTELTGVGGGTYAVTVTEANGKITVVSDILIDGPLQDIDIQNTALVDNVCFGDATGQIAVDISGGTPGYDLAWSSASYPDINGNSNTSLDQLPAGAYVLQLTDANGCLSEVTYQVTEPPLLEAEVISTADEACDQQNGFIEFSSIGGTGQHTAVLSGPAGQMTTFGSVFENLPAGDYSIEIQDENGCKTLLSSTIQFIESPEVEVISNTVLTCEDPILELDILISGASTDVEYNWYTFNGNIITPNDLSSVSVDAQGEYFIEILDFSTGCVAENSVLIIADQDLPNITIEVNESINCITPSVTIDASQSSSGADLASSWIDAAGNVIATDTYELEVTQSGTYTFEIVNTSNGCTVSQQAVVIDESEVVTPAFEFTANELVVTFNDISNGGASQWLWDFGDGTVSTEQNPNHTFHVSGIYNVCLTASNDCGSQSVCQEVIVEASVSAILVNGASTHVSCAGGSDGAIAIDVSGGSGGFSYLWSGPEGFTSAEEDLSNLSQGIYSVIVTDSDGNEMIYTIEISEPEALQIETSMIDVLSCFGDVNGEINVIVTGGVLPYTYSWSNGITENIAQSLVAGTYSVTVTDANGCELVSDMYTISEPSQIELNSLTIENASGAATSDGTIDVTIIGGTPPYTYTWSNGATTEDLNSVKPGVYTVEVVDANGCQFFSGEIEVSFSVGTDDPILAQSIQLSPNPASESVVIRWELPSSTDLTFDIYNSVGQSVKTFLQKGTANGNQKLNVSEWDSGLYFVLIRNEDRQAIKKLLVE